MKGRTESELLLNPDGSIYHLNLLPGECARNIVLVGDPGRVEMVSSHFNEIKYKKQKREFLTHTGRIGETELSVISSGIGTDNIDIVINEIDALFNVEFETGQPKLYTESLNFFRIGTCGGLQSDIEPLQAVLTSFAAGFDNLMSFYDFEQFSIEKQIETKLNEQLRNDKIGTQLYVFEGSAILRSLFENDMKQGISLACPGFYGPQGRSIRAQAKYPKVLDSLSSFNLNGLRVCNFEMETSAIFGLCRILGHQCCTTDLVIANRITGKAAKDYKPAMNELIESVLGKIMSLPA